MDGHTWVLPLALLVGRMGVALYDAFSPEHNSPLGAFDFRSRTE